MARNNKPLIIGAAALGGVALLATVYTLFGGGPPASPNGAENAVQAPAETKTIYVARREIPPRAALTSDLFTQKDVPANEVPLGAVTDLRTLRGLLSKQPIKAGDTLTSGPNGLTSPPVARVLPANIAIPQGFRGVAIYVNPDQTAAGLVDVGDRVDVIATHRFTLTAAPNTRIEGPGQIATGRVIGQNLQVLAVDKSIAAPPPTPVPPPDAAGAQPGAGAAAPVPTQPLPPGAEARIRVVLAAPLDVATRLVAAEDDGKLHIVIRNPTGADQFLVPEAREYPSRLVSVPPARTASASAPASNASKGSGSSTGSRSSDNSDLGGASSGRRRRSYSDDVPDIPVPQVGPVAPATIPSGSSSSGGGLPAPALGAGQSMPMAPAPRQENEVTVIRGTEKTRVLVPR